MKRLPYFKIIIAVSTFVFVLCTTSVTTKEIISSSFDAPYQYKNTKDSSPIEIGILLKESEEDEIEVEKEEIEEVPEKIVPTPTPSPTPSPIPTPSPTPEPTMKPVFPSVIETFGGTITGYGSDCTGCSNHTASGYDIGNGNIYYSDETYGKVRIVAGDRKYPFGTIVRISPCGTFTTSFYAIVLDRGGAIGLDKEIQFDLLFENESETIAFGQNEVTFEIMRLGYEAS